MYLVMLETNGNQRYIFSSPRLRENIGASAQLARLKEWTDQALIESGANIAWRQDTQAHTPSPRVNRAGDDATSNLSFIAQHTEWVSRASGKVIFMVQTEDLARAVIGQVTRTALAQAPGIDISGVYVTMDRQSVVDENLLKKVHAEAAAYALRRSPAQARFPQMPFLARAKDSSLPAVPPLRCILPGGLKDEAADDLTTAYSLPSRVKRYGAFQARQHLINLVITDSSVLELDYEVGRLVRDTTELINAYEELRGKTAENTLRDALLTSFATGLNAEPPSAGTDHASIADVTKLERRFQDGGGGQPTEASDSELSKIAVIHADGNGVGAIMRNLQAAVQCVPSDEFEAELGCKPDDADALRRFTLSVSGRLDEAVTRAFAAAWADVAVWAQIDACLRGRKLPTVPVVPVILGGDDVTAITSGDYAMIFAASFLERFEKQTAADGLLKYLHVVGKVAAGELQPGDVTPGPMTAAAGVAVVRRNFPFHIAYELAEKLVSRAKGVGKNQDPPCSALDFHVLFDTTVIDPDHQLSGYKDFTQRPFRLVKPPPAATREGEPVTWEDTCLRVARFRGFRRPGDERDRCEPFPRTRAARIRKLLSDRKLEEAVKHWEAAKKEATIAPEIESGGPTSPFDLLELADLLPSSYLRQAIERASSESTATTASTPERACS